MGDGVQGFRSDQDRSLLLWSWLRHVGVSWDCTCGAGGWDGLQKYSTDRPDTDGCSSDIRKEEMGETED